MASISLFKPVDCNVDFDTGNLAGKTAVVTGGVYFAPRHIGELSIHVTLSDAEAIRS
jgi:hypothetical protein